MNRSNRRIDHRIRRFEVSLYQHRRNIQRRTDIIKTLRDGIFGQHLLHGYFHVKEITKRVLVLNTIQPPQDHATFATPLRRNRIQSRRELFHQFRNLLRRRPRLVFRRHLAGLHAMNDFSP